MVFYTGVSFLSHWHTDSNIPCTLTFNGCTENDTSESAGFITANVR